MLNPDRLQTSIPLPALVLGIAGLIPFLGLPVLAALQIGATQDEAIDALVLYGIVILSFMGGAQWGLAMRAPAGSNAWLLYSVSVVPALVGWLAFTLPARPALLVLASAFGLLLAWDAWTVKQGIGPAWYPTLRLGLTTIVVLSVCTTAAFVV